MAHHTLPDRTFVVPKKNDKMRLVIDLSLLNPRATVSKIHDGPCSGFKRGMWATSIDLSEAYLHIPIHPKYWKFLVFQVRNRRCTRICKNCNDIQRKNMGSRMKMSWWLTRSHVRVCYVQESPVRCASKLIRVFVI